MPDIPEVKPVTKLILDKTSCSMGTGKTVTFKVSALSEDADLTLAPPVVWSENKKGTVITITDIDPENGTVRIKGIGPGTATLTATAADGSKKKVSCSVKVGTSIEKVAIKQKKNIATVEAGKKLSLTAEILPKKPAPIVKTLVWESDNPGIAAVDSKGGVTGVSAGMATITARPANELYDATAEIASYKVTVTAAKSPIAVESITLQKAVPTLAVGKSAAVKAYTYDPVKKKNLALNQKSVVFYSSAEDVLSVTPTGKMTAKKEGNATVIAVSLANPSIRATAEVTTYVAVSKIVLNATKSKVRKGKTGVVTVVQWNPAGATDKRVKWTATGADGKTKAGNIQAVEIAVLPAGKKPSELSDSDFVDARTTPVITQAGERICYRTLVATKKCVITACSMDGNKKAKYNVESRGYVTGLELKTGKAITGAGSSYTAKIKAGKSLKAAAVIKAEYGADKTIVWTSDNTDIETVKNGNIKVAKNAAKGSTATVTATAVTENGTCKVELTVTVD